MSKIRQLLSASVFVGLLILVGWVFLNYQDLVDQYKVYNYQPSPTVSTLAHNSSMSERGRFYFYLADPVVESPEEFNNDCQRSEVGNPILGCYKPDVEKIYIYDIKNAELDGSKEVTASHEMLHVVYSRLGGTKKQEIDKLLDSAYEKVKTSELEERLAYYEKSQPGSSYNELHSILGTEFSNLGRELDQYYNEYFNDRSVVLGLYSKYNQRFKDIVAESDRLNQEIAEMKTEIDGLLTSYTTELESLNKQVNEFNSRASSAQFNSRQEFDRERQLLIVKQQNISNEKQTIIEEIDEYNTKVNRINELGWRLNQLNDSLDSMKAVE